MGTRLLGRNVHISRVEQLAESNVVGVVQGRIGSCSVVQDHGPEDQDINATRSSDRSTTLVPRPLLVTIHLDELGEHIDTRTRYRNDATRLPAIRQQFLAYLTLCTFPVD